MDPQTPAPSPDTPSQESVKYGGAWSRFWAYFVDSVLCGFFIFLFFDYLVFVKGESISLDQLATKYFWLGLIYLIVFIFYLVYFTYKKGTTIGKDLYGLKVVQNSTHASLALPQTILRESSRNLLPLIPIIGGLLYLVNGLMMIFSKEKRGIHDRIAKTQVLKVKNPWPLSKQILIFLVVLILLIPPTVAEIIVSDEQKSALIKQKNQVLPKDEQTNQSINSESERETFISSKYKYAITYPKNWTALKGKDIDAADKEKSLSIADYNNEDCCWIVVEMLDQNWQEIESTHPWISSPTPTTLAGASGIEGEQSLKKEPPLKVAKYIYLQHPTLPGVVISIRVEGNNKELLDSVLSSLKFS